jgi:Tfp pilus assembly protein FimT
VNGDRVRRLAVTAGRRIFPPRTRATARGAALIDVICGCAVMLTVLSISIPNLLAMRERDETRLAARHVAARLQRLRLEALKRNRAVALRLDPHDLGRADAYVDGDSDGVLQSDVNAGIDRLMPGEARLTQGFDGVAVAIAHDVPDPDGSGTLVAGSDPIRIGSSNFVTFSPVSSSTSGTVYLAGQGGSQVCVRILGATGRMRVMWFDRGQQSWRQD